MRIGTKTCLRLTALRFWRLQFCDYRTIKLTQNWVCFTNPCINLHQSPCSALRHSWIPSQGPWTYRHAAGRFPPLYEHWFCFSGETSRLGLFSADVHYNENRLSVCWRHVQRMRTVPIRNTATLLKALPETIGHTCLLKVDKTCMNIFCILKICPKFYGEWIFCLWCYGQNENRTGFLQIWFNYLVASFSRHMTYIVFLLLCGDDQPSLPIFRCPSWKPHHLKHTSKNQETSYLIKAWAFQFKFRRNLQPVVCLRGGERGTCLGPLILGSPLEVLRAYIFLTFGEKFIIHSSQSKSQVSTLLSRAPLQKL